MFSAANPNPDPVCPLDPLDRVAIGYLILPLGIFLGGWFEWWAALPLIACIAYAIKPLLAKWPVSGASLPVTRLQLAVAVVIGCSWTVFGGTDHLVFANADWHVRDAVLHDLVASPWPVGYGLLDGKESVLRAPVAFFLPAALVGKVAGLPMAHLAMALWTATGATLFLLQVLSLTPSRLGTAVLVGVVVVLFSGFDIIGSLLNDGPHFRSGWNIMTHLEWWAGTYQYSSMTTQLFWVPNHALGGWLMIGLLYRDNRRFTELETMLPILVVAIALWSPLTAIGLVPFVLWKAGAGSVRRQSLSILNPRVWAPALAVGLAVAAYLALDLGRIPKGLPLRGAGDVITMDLLRQAQFFLLEAGIIGIAILVIRRSNEVILALLILAMLPFVSFGPGNDLVMRASIPSLAVLTIGTCLALIEQDAGNRGVCKKAFLGGMLVIGAVTPVAEFARATMVPAWPINLRATLIGANCGKFAPHYVARLGGEVIDRILRQPNRLPLGPQGPESCDNPAWGHIPAVTSE